MPDVYDASQKIELFSSVGGGTLEVGDTVRILWQASPKIHQVFIDLSLDGGKTWTALGRQASNGTRRSFAWIVPQLIQKKITISEHCLMRVRSADFLHKATMSDNF